MALGNYGQLQSAIGSWAYNRTDVPTADCITLGEDRLNTDLRLRMMEVETALTGTIGSRYVALPSAFLEPLACWLEMTYGREPVEFVSPDEMPNWAGQVQPMYWTVDGANLAFEAPLQSAYSLTLRFLQGFRLGTTAPADGTQTNWLLTNWPSAYLAACNVEAALWLQDDAQATRWEARYEKAISDINSKESRSRSLATMRVDRALLPIRPSSNITRGF